MHTMEAGAMEAMDMARDPLMLRPTTDGAPMDMESVQLMLRLTMAAGAMEAMDMARDLLMPRPTTAAGAMEAMDMARDPLMLRPTTDGAPMDMESVQLML